MKKLNLLILLTITVISACKKDQVPQPNAAITKSSPNAVPTGTTPGTSSSVITITGIGPTTGTHNTVLTIYGTNFGSSASDVSVFMGNGKDSATVQSVTPTQIKVVVPITSTGGALVKIKNSQPLFTPVFQYQYSFLSDPYTGGSIWLKSQADVDAFVAQNKNTPLQINGDVAIGNSPGITTDITSLAGLAIIKTITGQLSIYGVDIPDASFLKNLESVSTIGINSCSFTDIDLNQLKNPLGSVFLVKLNNLQHLGIHLPNTLTTVSITNCPQLADLSFMNDVSSINYITLDNTGATSIKFSNLSKVIYTMEIKDNANLTALESPSLAAANMLTLQNDPLLTKISMPALTTLTYAFTVSSTGLTDMSAFNSLRQTGIITFNSNSKLVSLNGLQNLSKPTAGIITDNLKLTDICPFKTVLKTLYGTTYQVVVPSFGSDINGGYRPSTYTNKAALTFTGNGVTDVLTAVAACP